jgi:hypothetical protein
MNYVNGKLLQCVRRKFRKGSPFGQKSVTGLLENGMLQKEFDRILGSVIRQEFVEGPV